MTPAAGALAFAAKAERALVAARRLLADDDSEGTCNRAYYAMYYAAQVALIQITSTDIAYKTHRGLIADFGKHVVVPGHMNAEFGRSLNEVQRLRELADYLGEPPSIDSASFALQAAERFVSAVQDVGRRDA